MDPRKLFIDERLTGLCTYCGAAPESRDHVPSRVLLDEPFPANLPVAEACESCNNSFSQDEEYVACLIECVICGTAEPSAVQRHKVRKILNKRPLLATKIRESCEKDAGGNLVWQVDGTKIRNVVLKLARGHLAFELNVFHLEPPYVLEFQPIITMSRKGLNAFESLPEENVLFPEVGSRAFISMWESPGTDWHDWREVQPGRYRYRVEQSHAGDKVQFVLSEYLACNVIWT